MRATELHAPLLASLLASSLFKTIYFRIETSRKNNDYSFLSTRYALSVACIPFRSTFLLAIREACFTLSPTIAISCFYTCSTQAFHPGINCLSCPSTKGRLMYFIFLSCLHQSLPIGVRTRAFPCKHRASLIAWYYRPPCRPISASSLVNRRLTVYLHVQSSSDETLLL